MTELTEYVDPPPAAPDFVVGFDAGQVRDYSALAILERRERPAAHAPVPGPESWAAKLGLGTRPAPVPMEAHYACGHLERYPLNESYPDQAKRTVATLHHLRETIDRRGGGRLFLCLDATGVGLAVADLFREADLAGATFAGIVITGGDAAHPDGRGGWRTPKRDLVAAVQILLQSRRLKVAASLPAAATLEQELRGFRAKITLAGHDQFGAGEDWRSAPHDDLVLALAVAAWYGEAVLTGLPVAVHEALERSFAWQAGPAWRR